MGRRRKATTQDETRLDAEAYQEQARVLASAEEAAAEATELEYDETFLKFVEAEGGVGIDPLSDDAVRLQAKFATKGVHPFDVLRRIVANPFCVPRDRIAASKLLLEYTARKVPQQLEVSGRGGDALKLDSRQLSTLSATELETLETLLQKAASVSPKA